MDETTAADALGRFLTLADTAELLNVTIDEAFSLVRSGELQAIRIGAQGPWRVERSILEAFIDAQYEEARRISLWNQAEFTDLPELFDRKTRGNSHLQQ